MRHRPSCGRSSMLRAPQRHNLHALHRLVDSARPVLRASRPHLGECSWHCEAVVTLIVLAEVRHAAFETAVAPHLPVYRCENLLLGLTVVVDAVNDSDAARQIWRNAASATGSVVRFVLLRPPPPEEHHRRIHGRARALRHVGEPTWDQVMERARTYEEWSDEPIDVSASEPVDLLVRQLEHVLGAGQ